MMRGERIEELAASAYRDGLTPVDVAELVVQAVAEETAGFSAACAMLLARKVIAALLDAGWVMPAGTAPGSGEDPAP